MLALVCDSTNALVPGHSGSEAKVRESLTALIGTLKGRVAVTAFASNVARLDSIAHAAEGPWPQARAGRPLHAQDRGGGARHRLSRRIFPPTLDETEAAELPRAQGALSVSPAARASRAPRWRASPTAIIPMSQLGKGDAVIFSSRIIPGNELAIFELHNKLVGAGRRKC